MKNIDRFNEAFAHMEHAVMGRRLEKFSLRHRFWLTALGSPVVTGGETTLMDLELAARVCAIRFDRLDRRLPQLLTRGPRWWDRLGYLMRVFSRNTEREYRLIQAYLTDHGCPPATWEEAEVIEDPTPDGRPRESGPLPGVFGLITGLIRGTGWDPERVWALSPGEAEWYLAGVFLHRGVDVGLKTAEDEEMEEFLRARMQKPKPVTRAGVHGETEDRSGGGIPPEGIGGTENQVGGLRGGSVGAGGVAGSGSDESTGGMGGLPGDS